MHDFRKLEVYADSVRWTADVYDWTKSLPADERFGLTAQIRRCAASVPANIAEGAGRGGNKEFAWFLRIAIGSLCEIHSHLDVAVAAAIADESAIEAIRTRGDVLLRRIRVLERTIRSRT